MPIGITEDYDQQERELLYKLLCIESTKYPIDSTQFAVAVRAMTDARNADPIMSAVEYGERQLQVLWVVLASASHDYPVDSEEFHVLTKAMADAREQM
jgi:hypothetical protein